MNKKLKMEKISFNFLHLSLKEALLSFLEVVQTGVRGIVTDEMGEPLPKANIEVSGISEKNITTSSLGEYWRLLAPGKYWYAEQN